MKLAVDQPVRIAVEGVGELPAIVEASDGDVITLVLTVRGDADASARLHDRPATVEGVSSRGVVRVSGHVERDAERPERLRIHREDAAVVQRREAVRVDAVLAVHFTLPFTGRRASTTTLDVSRTGLRIAEPFLLAVGAPLELDLELEPGAARVAIAGRVTRSACEGTKGVVVERIAPDDEDRLVAYLTERQRLALRVARGS